MKKQRSFIFFSSLIALLSVLQSCSRTGDDVWDDTKSAGRHIQRGAMALTGYHQDSRQVRNRSDFEGIDDQYADSDAGYQQADYQNQSQYGYQQAPQEYDFVPLQDDSNQCAMNEYISRQPRENPGDPGSSIPGIDSFLDPNTIPQLKGIFGVIYFDYDSSLVRGDANLQIIHRIADYIKTHPNVYVFVEGHTDERGAQAYNYALGSRRANTVRDVLINDGVSPDNLFTITYGKDRPVVLENHEEAYSKNRRAEFKAYVR